ncbi:hypothetical protein LTR78_003349 [Recurvomyces mirabilis]|uniref:AB hydrolase-1 domain-containing protein n=1 Tax=Recurvomyces mirabilis TaxID=574656 RepID=A0AAE0WRQ4_9PEZI|nr:hypothetical protein LTR78_003349 [Recurvomyces mirabilis]KAK5154615.1 hypothetical protein LTS14_006753 [Recurvomyces mirabilis]
MPSTPPTIILAHAAFHQPAHYIDFTAALGGVGLTEYRIPQLPSSSTSPPTADALAQDVKVLSKTIRSCLTSGRDVLLVAHSYGGVPLSEALGEIGGAAGGKGDAKVLGVVFVAAIVPSEGENMGSAMKTGVAEWVKIEGNICTANEPAKTFFNTLSSKTALEKAVQQIRPQSMTSFMTPVKHAGWNEYPCAYIKCTKDNSTSVEDQDHMIAKLRKQCEWKPTVVEVASDHCPFLGMPDTIAAMLKRLVDDAE